MITEQTHDLLALTAQVAQMLCTRGWRLATAESCTGGLIAATCTELAGSSEWFDRGFVTYSNAAKTEQLGVDAGLIEQYGAVSEPVARAMVTGALRHSHAHVALAVTGIAGPSGGSKDKPVGTVWFGWGWAEAGADQRRVQITSEVMHWLGDRASVRQATLRHALSRLLVQQLI